MTKRYIWIDPAAEMRWLWIPFGCEMYKRFGATPLLLCRTEKDREYYMSQVPDGAPFEAVVLPDRYSMAMTGNGLPDIDGALSILKKFEKESGYCFMRDVALPDRQFSRTYVFGADKVAKSKSTARANHETVWRVGARIVESAQELFERYPPILFVSLTGGTGMASRPFIAILKRHGVPVRNMIHTRFGFRYYWSEDEVHNSQRLNNLIAAEPLPDDETVNRVLQQLRPTGDFEYYVTKMRKQRRLDRLAYLVLQNMYKHLRYRLGRSRKAKIGYYMLGEIGMIVNGRTQAKYLTGPDCPRLADLDDRYRYVFFPLQVEPEISLHGLAPEYFDQINTIAQISFNLPADAKLVVKEHPAQIGRRGTAFYKKIQSFPNVILISELEHSYPVMRSCDLVLSVTSSVAHEAAVMGKKVVYLFGNGPLSMLPHVKGLPKNQGFRALTDLLDDANWPSEADRVREGVRYYVGLERNASLDFASMGTDMFNRSRVSRPEEIETITDSLVVSLDAGFGADARQKDVSAA